MSAPVKQSTYCLKYASEGVGVGVGVGVIVA